MLTKQVTAMIDPAKETQVKCPRCHRFVPKHELVLKMSSLQAPVEVCLACSTETH
jgi:hypothetical protein